MDINNQSVELIGIVFAENYMRFEKGTCISLTDKYIFESVKDDKGGFKIKIRDNDNKKGFSDIIETVHGNSKIKINCKAFIGNNGTGKSTILDLINRYYGSKSFRLIHGKFYLNDGSGPIPADKELDYSFDISEDSLLMDNISVGFLFENVNTNIHYILSGRISYKNNQYETKNTGLYACNTIKIKPSRTSADYNNLIINDDMFKLTKNYLVNSVNLCDNVDKIERKFLLKLDNLRVNIKDLDGQNYIVGLLEYVKILLENRDYSSYPENISGDPKYYHLFKNIYDALNDNKNNFIIILIYYVFYVISIIESNIFGEENNGNNIKELKSQGIKLLKDYGDIVKKRFYEILRVETRKIVKLKRDKDEIDEILIRVINTTEDESIILVEKWKDIYKLCQFYKFIMDINSGNVKSYEGYNFSLKFLEPLFNKKLYSNYDSIFIDIDYDEYKKIFSINNNLDYGGTNFFTSLGIKVDDKYFIDSISSGERAMISYLSNINKLKKDHNILKLIVIIDEPETSLHIERQRKFISTFTNGILDIINGKNINSGNFEVMIYMATHSPYIISDLPKDNVVFLSRKDETKDEYLNSYTKVVSFEELFGKNPQNTFMCNIPEITKDGFFIDSQYGHLGEQLIKKLIESKDKDIFDEFKKLFGDEYILEYLLFKYLWSDDNN